jgi:hypothetical protein
MAREDVRGFSVVEVLVALAAAAMMLAAIASLAHGAALSGRRTVRRFGEIALAQSLLSQPTGRDANGDQQAGEAAGGLRWNLAMAPWGGEPVAAGWAPAIVRFEARDGGNGRWSVETIRLVKAVEK